MWLLKVTLERLVCTVRRDSQVRQVHLALMASLVLLAHQVTRAALGFEEFLAQLAAQVMYLIYYMGSSWSSYLLRFMDSH